jgi:hypothetical protein
MNKSFALFALLFSIAATAQTDVRNTSLAFAGGVYPTFSVVFSGTDKATVEKWFKDQLKPISADLGGKKELMSIGTRLPEVSSDTIRLFMKADQPKGSQEVTAHVAFRVNMAFVGPDNEERQREGCRTWVYQNAVMLKKHLAQKDLEAGQKQLGLLENELAGLVKEKDRAQNGIEKAQRNIIEDEQAKVGTEGETKIMETTIDAKKQEVATAPTETNTKELQTLMKDQEKLRKKAQKLSNDIEDGKKKIEDLRFQIKKNLADQDTKSKAIEAQKKIVEELTAKLAGIN